MTVDLGVESLSPASGSVLTAESGADFGFCLSVCLSVSLSAPPPLARALSLSQNKIKH